VVIPDTPAGHALAAWLDAFNSGERARIEAYLARYEPSGSVERTLGFRKLTGGFQLVGIDCSDRLRVDFSVQERARPTAGIGQIEVKDGDPPEIVTFTLQAIPPGMSAADAAVKVDAAGRRRVLDGIVTKLTELYVFPDVAETMVKALGAREKNGDYDASDSGYTFASQLTQHLQAVSHDKHLRVQCVPTVLPKEEPDPLEEPPVDDETRAHLLRDNCGFEKVERLEHNIGPTPSSSTCATTTAARRRWWRGSRPTCSRSART
jgi:hypothetical protein